MACVYTSKHVFLDRDHTDVAAAFLVSADKVVSVAPRAQAQELATAQHAELVDFGDAFLSPGFGDAHQHVMHAALAPSILADEYCGTSEADCIERLKTFAAKPTTPQAGWLITHGWRDALWTNPQNPGVPAPAPTKASLDAVFPTRPVAMYSGDGHTLWVNTAGLAALGITDQTAPPAGGSFDRDASGQLTGVLREAAGMQYLARVLRSLTIEQLAPIYQSYFHKLASLGVTSVSDMALSLIPGADGINAPVYQLLESQGALTVRAHLYPTLSDNLSNLQELQATLTGPALRAPGFKQFFDGVSSQHTAWCSEPYSNARFAGDKGHATVEAACMRELVLAAASQHLATRIHAIGDAAVHTALDIFTEAYERYGTPAQGANTIEHAEDIQPQDISRFAYAHVVASVQPPHITIDTTQPARDLGLERARRMWPFDQMLASGTTLAFGTDAPVVDANSATVLYTACYRTLMVPPQQNPAGSASAYDPFYPEHDLTRTQALLAYTQGSAAAVGRAHELGKLAPGYFADFVVWDNNLLTCTAAELKRARPLKTFMGGREVYSRLRARAKIVRTGSR